jgi:hypothetical protein
MRQEAVVVAVRSAEDVVLTTSLRAHGPSSWVGVDPQLGPVLWEDLLDRKADMGDALDAPATEVDVGAAVVDVDAAVAVGGSLEQEDRALVHDGDDRCREAVAQAQREKASAELMNARWVGEGNVDTGSEEDEEDDVERRAEAEAVVEVDEREDVVVILLVEACRLATKRGVDVYYLEVLDPCLSTIYVW